MRLSILCFFYGLVLMGLSQPAFSASSSSSSSVTFLNERRKNLRQMGSGEKEEVERNKTMVRALTSSHRKVRQMAYDLLMESVDRTYLLSDFDHIPTRFPLDVQKALLEKAVSNAPGWRAGHSRRLAIKLLKKLGAFNLIDPALELELKDQAFNKLNSVEHRQSAISILKSIGELQAITQERILALLFSNQDTTLQTIEEIMTKTKLHIKTENFLVDQLINERNSLINSLIYRILNSAQIMSLHNLKKLSSHLFPEEMSQSEQKQVTNLLIKYLPEMGESMETNTIYHLLIAKLKNPAITEFQAKMIGQVLLKGVKYLSVHAQIQLVRLFPQHPKLVTDVLKRKKILEAVVENELLTFIDRAVTVEDQRKIVQILRPKTSFLRRCSQAFWF